MVGIGLGSQAPINLLCLGAHSDDIEIGAGGTILKMIANDQIKKIKWVVFSSNEVRKKEAEHSASLFLENCHEKEVIVNSFRDGFLQLQGEEVKKYFEEIKQGFVPDVVLTHYRNDRHQDHRFLSDLTWNTWRNHLILEYEIPKYDGDVGNPNFFVSLDKDILAKKNRYIKEAFVSQNTKQWFNDETFNALPKLRGIESVSNYAEAFYARKIVFYP